MRTATRLRDRLRHWLSIVARTARAVVGAPDYERYLAHMSRHHPHAVPLARDAFAREREQARYSRPGARCC